VIVVDSSVWIAWIRDFNTPETAKLDALDPGDILLGDIVLLEILRGARDDLQARRLETRFRRFRIAAMLDAGLAATAAAYYRRLRSFGKTIRNTPDLIIGTYCIEYGHDLLQDHRDFLPMAEHLGLRLA
jgi:predicted nucleic acid-binding protein